MSVKVVQGLIGETKPDFGKPAKDVQATNSPVVSSQAAISSAARSVAASSEAVSVSVRSSRPSGKSERLRDADEAKDVAEKVADKIKGDKNSVDAHGSLSAANSAPHLA